MVALNVHLKKMIAMVITLFTVSALMVSPAKAQESSASTYLAYITEYTYDTAETVYYLEEFMYAALAMLNSWMLPDKSDTTANMQALFVNATNTALQNSTTQAALQPQLTGDFLSDVNISNMNYVNDFTYQTLLGKPFANPDPRGRKVDSAYNYIKNVSGLNITHQAPIMKDWKGSKLDKERYRDFYMTVSSIQTYNAYLLSQLYVDAVKGNPLTQQQNALMQQASNSDWFSQIASEHIGIVLRQILMYNSQVYVLLTQLVQTQKQLLSAQAMTNTLLVLGNQFNETQLLTKATGVSQ